MLHSPTIIPADLLKQVHDDTRKLAAALKSRAQIVPWLSGWAFLGWLPNERAIRTARDYLIFLSNNQWDKEPKDREIIRDGVERIRDALNLPETQRSSR